MPWHRKVRALDFHVATCMECDCTIMAGLCCYGPVLGPGQHIGGKRHEGSGSAASLTEFPVEGVAVALYSPSLI